MDIPLFIWTEFLKWLGIFAAPLKNPEMLWVIIPVYLNWLFKEIFEEKKFTRFGDAISNGAIILWAGIDWIRFAVREISTNVIALDSEIIMKVIFACIILLYGIIIIVMGIKLKKITHYIGRIREVTYVLLMFTPIMYGVIALTFENIALMVILFPLFYYIVEGINYITPNPKAYEEESEEEKAKDLGSIKHHINSSELSFSKPHKNRNSADGKKAFQSSAPGADNKSENTDLDSIEEELKKLGG